MALSKQDQISLQTLWEGIQQIKIGMLTHSKVDPIQTKLSSIQMSLDTLVVSLEQRIGANEDNLQDLSTRINDLTKDNAYLCQSSVVCVMCSRLLCPYLVCFLSSSDVIIS